MHVIGVVSQKGGVGKSTITRMLAREFVVNDWTTLIGDTDNGQTTSTNWVATRNKHNVTPELIAQPVAKLSRVMLQNFDLVIFDGKPHSSTETLEIAKLSQMLVIPTGVSMDDLRPAVILGHELKAKGIPRERMIFVLTRTGDSETEVSDARNYMALGGYDTAEADLPERTGYRMAQNIGRTVAETVFPSLNERADKLAQELMDRFAKLTGIA
ncbi:ParA family protein [Inquilinus sp. OTU3971]|uniref:ParA family protein n=1 Tax=Inquilinus sp. OTU3971 TaxID=3043855 RepID=UPI00313BBD00